jgi:uncharacterized membrane protein
MELKGVLFSAAFSWVLGGVYALALYHALRQAPWGRLRSTEQLHVLLGTIVCLALLWQVRATLNHELAFHLLGVTAVTLMFGWSLAVIAASLALVIVTINAGGWDAFFINAVISGVLPISMTQVLMICIRYYLPRTFFVYVLVNGFLTAGLVGITSGCLAAWLLIWSGAYSFAQLDHTLLPFFPLMFLPEAAVNGWVVVALVAFRPAWVGSFSDEMYLKGK